MKFQKNIAVTIVTVAVLLPLGAALVLLIEGGRQLAAAQQELVEKQVEHGRLYQRNPFPSRENIAREEANRRTLEDWSGKLLAAVRRGGVGRLERSPSTFMRRLETTRNSLLRAAGDRVDTNFGFGFDKYFSDNALPDPEHVPDLTQQLVVMDRLARALFESDIDRLLSFSRDPVERGGSGERTGRSRRRRADEPTGFEKHELYTRMHFELRFRTGERALWEALNALAKHEMFVVVTVLEMEKESEDVRIPAVGVGATGRESVEAALAGVPLRKLSREQRLCSGPQLAARMSVRLGLDVFMFRGE